MNTPLHPPPPTLDDTNRGIVFFNADQKIDLCNEQFCSMMRMPRSEMQGLDLWQFVNLDDIAPRQEDIQRFIKGETETLNLKMRILRKDGSMFWVNALIYAFYKEDKELIYWVGAYTEISEPV